MQRGGDGGIYVRCGSEIRANTRRSQIEASAVTEMDLVVRARKPAWRFQPTSCLHFLSGTDAHPSAWGSSVTLIKSCPEIARSGSIIFTALGAIYFLIRMQAHPTNHIDRGSARRRPCAHLRRKYLLSQSRFSTRRAPTPTAANRRGHAMTPHDRFSAATPLLPTSALILFQVFHQDRPFCRSPLFGQPADSTCPGLSRVPLDAT